MSKTLLSAFAALAGCVTGGAASRDECRPFDQHCERTVLYDCSPDIELLQRDGDVVYMWREVLVCEDDPILGPQTCLEQEHSSGRVEATCDVDSSRPDAP